MTLHETSIEVVVVPPPADSPSPEPHHLAYAVEELALAPTLAAKVVVVENKKEGLHMEQDQEEEQQPSLTTASNTITTTTSRPAPTLKRMVTSVSFDPLPTSKEKGENHLLLSVTPARRRREVSFDISYSAQVVSRSRSDSRAVTCTVDVDGDETTTTTTTTVAAGGVEEEDLTKRPTWVPDREAPSCHQCAKGFTFIRRRHHCRACGGVFCGACSSNRITIPRLDYTSAEVRVCDHCWVREAELRYRKPSVSLFASASLVPASAVRRRPRRQSLSKSSEVEINKNLLKRSLRNMEMASALANAQVEQRQSEKKNEDVDAGHERKENR